MNKKLYKDTFSQIRPSDETVERILTMTERKKYIVLRKALAIILVVTLAICTVGIIADATADGEVSEKISEVAENVSKKLRVFINGKETDNFEFITETDENGETHYKASIDLPDERYFSVEGIDEALTDIIEFSIEASGSEDGDYVNEVIISDSEETYVPTTATAG